MIQLFIGFHIKYKSILQSLVGMVKIFMICILIIKTFTKVFILMLGLSRFILNNIENKVEKLDSN